jgi:hypothetical protein
MNLQIFVHFRNLQCIFYRLFLRDLLKNYLHRYRYKQFVWSGAILFYLVIGRLLTKQFLMRTYHCNTLKVAKEKGHKLQ